MTNDGLELKIRARPSRRDSLTRDVRSRALRVLAVVPGEPSGSSMIFCRRQIDVMERLGVVSQRFFLRTRTSPFGLIFEFCRLRKIIRIFKPDVIHAHFGTMTGFFCCLGSPVPVVTNFRGSDLNPVPSERGPRIWLAHCMSHIAARYSNRIICVSQQLKQRLSLRDQCRASVIPMGYSPDIFRPIPQVMAREQIGWHHEDPVLLFNAGLSPVVKRLDLAEAAYSVARSIVPNLRFEVMRGNVPPDQMPLFMNAADALIVTSDYEGSPNVVKESIGCGLPVVSVAVGDVPERLVGISPSQIVDRDKFALGKAVADVIQSRQRSNGPAVGIRDLGDVVIARRVIAVLREAVGAKLT